MAFNISNAKLLDFIGKGTQWKSYNEIDTKSLYSLNSIGKIVTCQEQSFKIGVSL